MTFDTTSESFLIVMKKINLEKNIQLCFNSGFGILITAENDEDFRNATVSIQTGLELLIKYYLIRKDELLIFKNITYKTILIKRNDLIKNVKLKSTNTINYSKCKEILEYFSDLPKKNSKYLNDLGNQRNKCVHFEYSYDEKKLRKLLISHIYQFICDLILEMKLDPKTFIQESYIDSLDNYKKTIDNEIINNYNLKIESAKKHYNVGLSYEDRVQKANAEDYTLKSYNLIVNCPACKNNALLTRKIQLNLTSTMRFSAVYSRNLILKELSCHHCGLNIKNYDQLRLKFIDRERVLKKLISHIYPDDYDCPPEDCPDDYDCPPEDCPDDYDCPPEDCPDDYDCAPEDC